MKKLLNVSETIAVIVFGLSCQIVQATDQQAVTTSSFIMDDQKLDSYSLHRELERSFSLPTPIYKPWPPHGYTIEDMENPKFTSFLNKQTDLDYQIKDSAYKLRLHRQRDHINPEDHDLYIHIPSFSEGMLLEKVEILKSKLQPFELESLTTLSLNPGQFELKSFEFESLTTLSLSPSQFELNNDIKNIGTN